MASSSQNLPDHRKLALIIGNGDYLRAENRHGNSANNARELSSLLKTINFDVTTACDRNKHQMTTDIIDFYKTVRDGDLTLVYFCGHGCQISEKNYLMPVDDARIETNRDVEDFSINVESTLARLVKRNPSYVTILILDCCRPYALQGASTATSMADGTGLHEMKTSDGAFIQFACAANQTVSNDLFTKHLLKNIAQENVDIGDIFRRISDDVYRESNKKQRPWSTNGLLRHQQVYLNENDLSTAKFLSKQPLSSDEKNYYEECKEYYHLTDQPLISIADEVFDNNTEMPSSSIKFGIDEDCNKFDLKDFLSTICDKLNLTTKDIAVKQIQEGSTIIEAEIYNKFESNDKKIGLRMIAKKCTDEFRKLLAKMKMFFMFMGPIKSLFKMQKYRAEIKLNPEYNRIYANGHNYWVGAINDGKDRGNKPYYCPIGWQRWSFYVTDNFDAKFKGWCICYHGTKFSYGLSILLSGLKPADIDAHGPGIYATPSVNCAAHPRYAEVKKLPSSSRNKLFKTGKYMQFVLECRVHPSNIVKIDKETLGAGSNIIDPNINNEIIEWVINNQKKSLVDFNDPDSSIICTGLLTRVTDKHPGLLPESQWWYKSHLCDRPKCCLLGINLKSLQKQNENGDICNIIFD